MFDVARFEARLKQHIMKRDKYKRLIAETTAYLIKLRESRGCFSAVDNNSNSE